MAKYSGIKRDPEIRRCYWVWRNIKGRCLNPNDKSFSNYGGRGVGIHPSWMDFATFMYDMGPRPTPKHTVERNDNDGDYGPSNCRWAARIDQARNRRPHSRRINLPLGVHKSKSAYRAGITLGGKYIHLGRFSTVEAASAVACRARLANGFTLNGESRA